MVWKLMWRTQCCGNEQWREVGHLTTFWSVMGWLLAALPSCLQLKHWWTELRQLGQRKGSLEPCRSALQRSY